MAVSQRLNRLVERYPILRLLSPEKHFSYPWIGHPVLNRAGQHVARVIGSHGFSTWRRWQKSLHIDTGDVSDFDRNGVAVLSDFLPANDFELLRNEVHERVKYLDTAVPSGRPRSAGFGKPQPFAGGFDRFDGGTLNRFIDIDDHTPNAQSFTRGRRLSELCELCSGLHHRPESIAIYQTRHGDETRIPDLQKDLHRDTFHFAVKFWFYLDDVSMEDGPLNYVVGSHRLTRKRLAWEHKRAVASSDPSNPNKSGAFRIDEAELAELALPAPTAFPVQRNTLVIANVLGFHRRGAAQPGRERLALYSSLRPTPMAPMPY